MAKWQRPPNLHPREAKLEKLSVEEREALQREIAEKKPMVEGKEDGEFTTVTVAGQNPDAVASMKRDLRKKETALQRDEDLIARGREKDKVVRRIKEIEEKIRPHMPSQNEMWQRLGTQDSDLAVRKNLHFQKTYIKDLLELKNLQRRLEPEDPRSGNLEFIRPSK